MSSMRGNIWSGTFSSSTFIFYYFWDGWSEGQKDWWILCLQKSAANLEQYTKFGYLILPVLWPTRVALVGWCSNFPFITEKETVCKTVPVVLNGAWMCLDSALPPRENMSGSWWHIWCLHAPLSIWPLLLFCRNISSGFPLYAFDDVRTSAAFDWMIRFPSEMELFCMNKPVLR